MNYNDFRRKSRAIMVGNKGIGGDFPITVQSMTNTDTHDMIATYNQILRLQNEGCDIVRLAVPDLDAAKTFSFLKNEGIEIPLVADVHFDYKIAIAALENGADKIRINPGNIGSKDKIYEVVKACSERKIPIRIGVNSGSLEKHILEKYGSPTAEALAESALYHASLLEDFGFSDIAVSVKASNVENMLKANRILAEKTLYPLHLGVTEAGARERAIVKSSIGVGALLADGIGDTIRISLTDAPEEEVKIAKYILESLSISQKRGIDIVSCPTCGRTKIDLISLVKKFEDAAKEAGITSKNIKVALMGCVVNGPGEAREADIGIAGGNGEGLLFKKGEIIRKIKEENLVSELIKEIKSM